MNPEQTIEFLKAQREVMVAQVVLGQRNLEGLQAQNNAQKAIVDFQAVKARIETEVGGTINEETLVVTPTAANPAS